MSTKKKNNVRTRFPHKKPFFEEVDIEMNMLGTDLICQFL